MSDDTSTDTPAPAPERRKPGPKPGGTRTRAKAAPVTTTSTRGVSMNPCTNGNLLVKIEMEVPLILAIELANAVAMVQAKLNEEQPERTSPFPTAKVNGAKPQTRWQPTPQENA